MSKLLNIKEFCKDLKKIESPKIVNNKGKFTENGLFSEQIFGPIRNYTCQCGTFYGQSRNGEICPECNVEIINSNERRKRYAKIKLPLKVINPIFYDLISSIGGPKSKLDNLMNDEESVLYKKNNKYHVVNNSNIPQDAELFNFDESIYELIYGLSKLNMENDDKWKYIYDNIDNLMIDEIIVLPADLRPASRAGSKKGDYSHVVDKINKNYRKILIKKEKIQETNIDIKLSKKIYYDYYKQIQKTVNDLYDYILTSLSKKEGLIRGNILGKRIDFSGRAVITPDPTLKLDECKIPYFMFLELFKIQIAKALMDQGYDKFLNMAIQRIDDCISNKSYNLLDFCVGMLEDNPQYCLLNRQPSLHRLSVLGFKIKLEKMIHYIKDKDGNYIKNDDPNDLPYKWINIVNNVIKIHPLVCAPTNSDFDGDQIAIYIPISEKSKQEVLDKFLTTRNLSNPANSELTMIPSQDIILGIFTLTSNKFPKLQELIEYKNSKITKSRYIFNKCLPNDYPIIDYPLRKNELLKILNDIKDKYDENITSEVLDNIKRIGFKYATLYGPTISLNQCELKDKSIISNIYDGDIYQQLNRISSKETEEYLKNNFEYSYMIESGSRGSWEQARQIILSRGFVSNFNGEILPTPVKSNLIDGLTPDEFFISTYGCRKGMLNIGVSTGDSGYLSRKLIFACANLQKDPELDDCGTTDYLEINVDSMKKAEMLIFRFYLDENTNQLVEITKDNYKDLIGKIIKLRSPIFCKSYNICHKCYGNLYKILRTKYIGLISSQTLGERSTQLILKIFHNSLRKDTQVLDINGNSYSIEDVYNKVKNNEPFYVFSCSPEGKIEVSKVIDVHKDRFENKIVRVTLDNNEIIETTLEHEYILRNGDNVKAQDLKIGDSLMSIYFGNDRTLKDIFKNNHKIINIEFIELDEYEEFYDLTVDSEYHNFSLGSGIFIHNSGTAKIKDIKNDFKQDDIVADLSIVSKMFHHFDGKNYKQIVDDLFNVYIHIGKIHHIHIESIVAQLMWVVNRKWRLLENRNEIEPEFYSIQSIASKESWLLGLGFSDPKKHIIKGLLETGNYKGIFDKILLGEKL